MKSRALVADYMAMTGKTLRDMTTQGAKIAAEWLAEVTAPRGKGSDARRIGQAAIAGDLHRLFPRNPWADIKKSAGKNRADEFWAIFKAWRGQSKKRRQAGWAELARTLDGTGIKPAKGADGVRQAHQESKNKRGRPWKRARYFAENQRDVDRYIRELQKRVGYTKGGWAAAARQLGNSRLPSWMTGPGRGNTTSVGAVHEAKAVNLVRWADTATPPGQKEMANRIAQGRVQKMMQSAIDAIRRKNA